MHNLFSEKPFNSCGALLIIPFFLLLAFSAKGQDVSLIEKLKENKISIIEINTVSGAQIVSKEEYLTASYTLYTYKNGTYTVTSDTTEIKGRGNSTWIWPKKPFRLKLKNAKSLLSMPSSKHWALLANFSDKTLSRNKVAMDVGAFWGLPYNPKSEVVELVINGWHWGSYQLIEVPKIATDRVNITTINSKSGTPSGGVIFELDERLGEQYYFWTNQYQPITIKDPDDLNTTSVSIANSHLEYASNIFKNAENVLFGPNFTDPVNGYPKYIDTSSVYNWYLTQEIFKNVDLSRYSVYFFNDTKNNNKITFGPLWDFDLSSGVLEDPYGIRATENLWISRLYEDPAFVNAIKAKWNKKRADLLELITSKVNENARKLHFSQKVNFDFWNQFYGVITDEYTSFYQDVSYEDDIFYFKKWMNQRLHWLDQQFSNTLYHFIPVTKDVYQVVNEDVEVKGNLEAFQSFSNSGKFVITQAVKNGNIVLDENTGAYTYTPKPNYYGSDTAFFIYNDGVKNSDLGLIHFTILPVNDAPTAFNKSFIINEDEQYEFSSVNNINTLATDIENDSLIFEKISDPKHGIIQWQNNGRFIYKPDSNYFGNDQFFFKVKDSALYSNNASITFNINPVNDPPTILDTIYYFQIKESDHFDFDLNCVIFNDIIDVDNDKQQLKIAISKFTQFNGDLIETYAGFYRYQPTKKTIGLDSLKIKVLDLETSSKEVTVIFRILKDNLFENSNNILLFPNPTNNFIRLKDLTIDQIFIQHINGLQFNNIPFYKIGNDIIVNCVGLSSGTYIINLLYQNKLIGLKKFIKL